MDIDAAVVREPEGPFAIETVDLDAEPRPGELRVRVVGAGICHTDLLVRDQHVPTPLPAVLGQAVDVLGHGGTCAIIGAPPAGSEVSLNVNDMLVGRTVTGVTEGNANPDLFIPDLIDLYRRGKFPFDELVTYYAFDEIQQAVEDQEAGEVIKPILRVGEP